MLMVRYGDCSILLSGDVEYRSQLVLPQVYNLKADILKVPHHGATEMKRSFLLAVDPEYAFFTHNAGETVRAQQQLKDYGLHRMTFAAWGMITLQTDGHKWIVSQDLYPYMEKNIKAHLKSNTWINPGFDTPSWTSEEDRSP
jgi:beta-lactamase superfamily II metal-dependent hydrolase